MPSRRTGLKWERPKLGLLEYAGSRDNNLVWRGDLNGSTRGFHGGSVFVDPSSREERYKMIYLGLITDSEWAAFEEKYPGEADTMARRPDVGGYRCVFGVFGAVSPDGIRWSALPEPLMIHHADTLNTCSYDEDRKLYVAYVRAWQVDQRAAGGQAPDSTTWISVGRRSILRAVTIGIVISDDSLVPVLVTVEYRGCSPLLKRPPHFRGTAAVRRGIRRMMEKHHLPGRN